MKKEFKEVLSLASNVLLYAISIVLLLSLWLEINIICVVCIAMSILAIVIHILSLDNIKNWFKSINVFYFLVMFILSLSKLIDSDLGFNLGLAIFVILILAYIFFSFIKNKKVEEVEEVVEIKNTKTNKKKGKKNGKKKKK